MSGAQERKAEKMSKEARENDGEVRAGGPAAGLQRGADVPQEKKGKAKEEAMRNEATENKGQVKKGGHGAGVQEGVDRRQ